MDKKAITYQELSDNLYNSIISTDTFKVELERLPNNDNILYIEDDLTHNLTVNSGNISFTDIILTIKLIDIDKTYLYFEVLAAETSTEYKIPVRYLFNGNLGYIETGDFFVIRHSGLPTPENVKRISNIGTTLYASQYTNAGSCFLVKSETLLYKNITIENIITASFFNEYDNAIYLSYNIDNMVGDNILGSTISMQYPNTTFRSVGSSWAKSYTLGTWPTTSLNLFTYTLQDNKAFTVKIDDETNLVKKFGYFVWSGSCSMNTPKAQSNAMAYNTHFRVNVSFNFYPCYKNFNGIHKISVFDLNTSSVTVTTDPIFTYTKNLSLSTSNSKCWSEDHTSRYYTHYAACVGIDVNDLLSKANVSYTKIGNEIYIYYKDFLIAELIRNTRGVFLKMYCDISIDIPAGGVYVYSGITGNGTRNSVANVLSDNIQFYPPDYMPYDNDISVNTIYIIARYSNENTLSSFLPVAYPYFSYYTCKQGIYLLNINYDNDNFESYINRFNITDKPNKCVTDNYLYNMTNDLNCYIYRNILNERNNKIMLHDDIAIGKLPIIFSIRIYCVTRYVDSSTYYYNKSIIFDITYSLYLFKLNTNSNQYSVLYKSSADEVKLLSTNYDSAVDEFNTYDTFTPGYYDGSIFSDEIDDGIYLEYNGDGFYNPLEGILYHRSNKPFLILNNILQKCCTINTEFDLPNILNGSTIEFYADKLF